MLAPMITQHDYQWLFRKAPVMATSIGADGTYHDVNDALLARLGYARQEMVGHAPEAFVTADTARRLRDELRPALRRTGKLENKPVSLVTKSGEIVEALDQVRITFFSLR